MHTARAGLPNTAQIGPYALPVTGLCRSHGKRVIGDLYLPAFVTHGRQLLPVADGMAGRWPAPEAAIVIM